MSTDLRDRTSHPAPDEGPDAPEKPKPSLSITQVVGGALAAMTAAALGSRLSVAGTIVGAAFASVIAAVAGAIYTSSLRRTSETVRTVIKSRTRSGAPVETPQATTETTRFVPTWDDVEAFARETGDAQTPSGRRRIGWKPVLVGALLMFAMAAVALTGIELVTGHALSGGTGTTVGQVAERQSEPSTAPRKATKASPTPTPSPTRSAVPSATPSSTPSTEPTPQPSTSASAAPTASPTPTLSPSSRSSVFPSGPAGTP